jgi:hypothetical protein
MRLERAIEEAEGLLADAAEGMIRMVLIRRTIGRGLGRLASPLKKNTKEVARVVFAPEVL